MVMEWDDFGANHIISDMCQSHDCRDRLLELKKLNPKFKCTLFTIPAEITLDILYWLQANSDWVEFAVHGFKHDSNYECEKWTYEQMGNAMKVAQTFNSFQKIFRAPGWQISDECFRWLYEHNWIVADQAYNDARRPIGMKSYVYNDGDKTFRAGGNLVEAYHGHVWDVGWNGIYEDAEKVDSIVKDCKEFKFVSELF